MSEDQVARWQDKLDREFPNGLLAYFENRNPRGHANYLVPRVVVTEMAGLDPVVWFAVFSGSDKVFGPLQVLSYEQFGTSPRAVRVRFDNVKDPMVWTAALQPEAVQLMASTRAESVKNWPHGGTWEQGGPQDESASLRIQAGADCRVPAAGQGKRTGVSGHPRRPGHHRAGVRADGQPGHQDHLEAAREAAPGAAPLLRPVVRDRRAGRVHRPVRADPGPAAGRQGRNEHPRVVRHLTHGRITLLTIRV